MTPGPVSSADTIAHIRRVMDRLGCEQHPFVRKNQVEKLCFRRPGFVGSVLYYTPKEDRLVLLSAEEDRQPQMALLYCHAIDEEHLTLLLDDGFNILEKEGKCWIM